MALSISMRKILPLIRMINMWTLPASATVKLAKRTVIAAVVWVFVYLLWQH